MTTPMPAVFLVAITLLSGCANPLTYPKTSATDFITPELNKTTTVYIGEKMINEGVTETYPAINLLNKLTISNQIELTTGLYKVIAESRTAIYAEPSRDGTSYQPTGEIKPLKPGTERMKIIRITKETGEFCLVSAPGTIRANWCSKTTPVFEKVQATAISERGFQQTLIYTGRTGDYISVTYREFSNGFARPAFDNKASYDLRSSSLISYKGATLEILEATNQHITFKMSQGFR